MDTPLLMSTKKARKGNTWKNFLQRKWENLEAEEEGKNEKACKESPKKEAVGFFLCQMRKY